MPYAQPRPVATLAVLISAGLALASTPALADYRSDIGYTQLQQDLGTSLPDGTGVRATQVEGTATVNGQSAWMPDVTISEFIGKTITNESSAPAGLYSGHATTVGEEFYGSTASIAPGILNVAAFSANDWIGAGFLQTVQGNSGVLPDQSTSRIANHSYVGSTSDSYILRRVDWLVETDEFVQVAALNNGNGSSSTSALLASAFNVIAVGRSDGQQQLGSVALDSTYTAGRVRPDIVDPADSTSTATPHVSAAAALLVQTGHDNPGLSTDPVSVSVTNRAGIVIRNAERSEVLKAALMAGADRVTHNSAPNPTNLALYRDTPTNQSTNGLDRRYGAGQLNIRNSYWIIASGEQNSNEDGNVVVNGNRGFDYDPHFGGANSSNTTATYPLPTQNKPMLLTASLVWNLDIKGATGSGANVTLDTTATFRNLNLTLINVGNGNAVVASSVSTVENTENLWYVIPANAQYALRVTSVGASFDWDYGLAWQQLTDTDADGAYDGQDNCVNVPNGPLITDAGGNSQLDTNGDGIGDVCAGGTTPDAFTFTDQSNVAPSATITSAAVTITGLTGAAAISVTGGSYSIGCGGTFTTTAGTISNNQTVCVRHTSAAAASTATNTVLTVGGISDTFTSTTAAAGPADTTPDNFSFTDQTGVALSATITSAAVTITGLTGAAAISVTGGSYSIGCGTTYTTAAGTISNNQTVCVRHTSAAANSASIDTTLTIGGVFDTFTSTTVAPGATDAMPDPFSFTDIVGVAVDTLQTSNAVTISGIDAPAPISVVGGEYSIGCDGAFTPTGGTISNNQTVCVRHTSAAANSTSTDTTLTIGGVSDTFTSVTVAGSGSVDSGSGGGGGGGGALDGFSLVALGIMGWLRRKIAG